MVSTFRTFNQVFFTNIRLVCTCGSVGLKVQSGLCKTTTHTSARTSDCCLSRFMYGIVCTFVFITPDCDRSVARQRNNWFHSVTKSRISCPVTGLCRSLIAVAASCHTHTPNNPLPCCAPPTHPLCTAWAKSTPAASRGEFADVVNVGWLAR